MTIAKTLGFWALAATLLAGSTAQAENLIVVEARGIGIKPGSSVDSTKPLVLKHCPAGSLVIGTTNAPAASWTTPIVIRRVPLSASWRRAAESSVGCSARTQGAKRSATTEIVTILI